MTNSNFGAVHEHADHVETIGFRFLPVAVDPDQRGALQLLPLAVVNRLDRTAKLRSSTSFDLDEGDSPISLDNQIDVAPAISKASLDDSPAAPTKPPLRYSLSELSECLPGH